MHEALLKLALVDIITNGVDGYPLRFFLLFLLNSAGGVVARFVPVFKVSFISAAIFIFLNPLPVRPAVRPLALIKIL